MIFSSLSASSVVKICSKALESNKISDPDKIKKFHRLKGEALFELGSYPDAKLDYDYLLKLEPQNPEYLFMKAQILFHMGVPEKAMALIIKMSEKSPNSSKTLKGLAMASSFQGDWDSSRKYAIRTVQMGDDNPQIYVILAWADFKLKKRYQDCLKDIEEFFTRSGRSAPSEQLT